MAAMMDVEVLQEIPGYRAILKSVLKAQIQLLMEQLSCQAGEESIILTASIQDGSLSHLGSNTGKGFLEGRDEIKAQFLGYCLKNQHHKESKEAETLSYQRSRTLLPPSRRPRPRIRPGPYSVPSPGSSPPQFNVAALGSPFHMSSPHSHSGLTIPTIPTSNHNNTRSAIKTDQDNTVDNFLESVTNDNSSQLPGNNQCQGQSQSGSDTEKQLSSVTGDVDSEVPSEGSAGEEGNLHGVGEHSQSSTDWHNNSSPTQDDVTVKQENADDNGDEAASRHLGGIAFPGLDNAHHDFSKSLPEMSPSELKNVLYPQGVSKRSNGIDMSQINNNEPYDLTHNSEPYDLTHNNEPYDLTHNNEPYDLTPRKRGRPRKNQYLYPDPNPSLLSDNRRQPVMEASPTAPDDDGSLTDSFLMRKRGRPKKQFENLPPGIVSPAGISIGNGYVKCNICGKILKSTSMFTHKQSHLGIRNYSCGYCGKSFTQKGPLITHERVHTGEKPYHCDQCGKAFSAHSGLYQHRRRCQRQLLPQLHVNM